MFKNHNKRRLTHLMWKNDKNASKR